MMKMLNSRYAMYFNKRHHLVGHVFQGRYGAELIDSKDYLLDVSRYIHLNPVEANMVNPQAITNGAAIMLTFRILLTLI